MPAILNGRKAPRCCDYPLQPAGDGKYAECVICCRQYDLRGLLEAIRDQSAPKETK